MLTLTFALSSAVMYINFETKPINEKKLDCVYSELTAQFVLLAGFNTSENRKTEKTPAYFVSQSDSQSIFNHASVLGAKLRRYLCARSVFKLNLIANAQNILRWEMFPIS